MERRRKEIYRKEIEGLIYIKRGKKRRENTQLVSPVYIYRMINQLKIINWLMRMS